MKEKNCCVIGGNLTNERYCKEKFSELKNILENIITDLIENESVTQFISGMDLGLETFFAKRIIDYRNTYPNIKLTCVIPYETQAEFWSEEKRDDYFSTVEKSDKEIMLQKKYTSDAIANKNKFLIENCEFCILIRQEDPNEFLNSANLLLKNRTNLIGIDPHTFKITKHIFQSPWNTAT